MLKDIKARIKYKIFNGSNGLVLNITKFYNNHICKFVVQKLIKWLYLI